MKNLIIKLLVVVVAITLTTNLSAKSPSSIVNETIITHPTTFVEIQATNMIIYESIISIETLGLHITTLEERDIKAEVKDNNQNQTATATIMIKSLDGTSELGPYNLIEGTILSVVVDQREWVVVVEESSEGAIITNWY